MRPLNLPVAEKPAGSKALPPLPGKERLSAVFMGTPAFAAEILRQVAELDFLDIRAVYTQPDRPAGRGNKLKMPEVKELALSLGLPVLQPLNFKKTPEGDAAVEELAAFKPDLLLVAAYGLILPRRVLDIPSIMPINVHASLLPKYRGAAPIQRAVMNGDAVTGITIMRMEAGLDSGPMLLQRAVAIGIHDTSASLHEELAREGGELLAEALYRLRSGNLAQKPQQHDLATRAAKLEKSESLLSCALPRKTFHARVRGLTPWPGASIQLEREGAEPLTLRIEPGIYPAPPEAVDLYTAETAPGTVIGLAGDALVVALADGPYAILSLCPPGKKPMTGKAFANGYLNTGAAKFL